MEQDREIIECRECGSEFNLAAQHYYDNLCPSCQEDSRTWPGCARCSDRVPPGERTHITVQGARRDPSTVRLPVHEDCK